MITYRLRGLVNLHVAVTTALAGGLFLIMAGLARYSPFAWFQLSPQLNLVPYVLVIVLGMLFSVRFLSVVSSRIHSLGWPDAAWLATRQVSMMALILFTLIVATKDHTISRLFLGYYLIASWVLLLFTDRMLPRYLAGLVFSRQHRLPTLFLGHRKTLEKLDDWIAQKRYLGVAPVGFLSDDYSEEEYQAVGRFLGPTKELIPIIEKRQVAQVILLDVPANKAETETIVEACQTAGCRLLIYDNIAARLPVPMIPIVEEGHYFFTAQMEPLEDPFNRVVKRLFDIAVSLPVVTFILPPLCALVWIMQRRQAPGPLFFARPRGGPRDSEFHMLKFRSMYHQPEDGEKEAQQARAGDSRIYPFGQFLRKTSLDEFPQFWNVLAGDMSIVGPRPHLPKHDYEFSKVAKAYRTRFLVKPGITGLAQIRGYRGEITDPAVLQGRVQHDLIYITGWSVWLDLQIVAKTAWQVFFPPKSAY
jgi:exopolysaccharide biosynthesis polyprenyl glycosylphosphotransferase